MSDFWLILGLVGQGMFSARFVIQWLASERAHRSVVPTLFWVFSILGSTILLIYAVHRRDPVFILGQSLGLFIYSRNLYLIWREKGALPLGLG